jgi:hypothetical protein
MANLVQDDLQKDIQLKLRELQPADWVRDMLDHYRRTGTYRPTDLRRLLGDPNRGVEIGPNSSRSSFFAGRRGS